MPKIKERILFRGQWVTQTYVQKELRRMRCEAERLERNFGNEPRKKQAKHETC